MEGEGGKVHLCVEVNVRREGIGGTPAVCSWGKGGIQGEAHQKAELCLSVGIDKTS